MEMIVGKEVTRIRWADWEGRCVKAAGGGWTWRIQQEGAIGGRCANKTFVDRQACEGHLMDFVLDYGELNEELVITQGLLRTEELVLFS